jgi:diaminohydroxyphosphoribosylaminopyrimidine deaminase/5-amino-6-(5-phosphoribosylamino)uracil reductase
VRHVSGPNPTRVVLDRSLSLPKTHHLFDSSVDTIVLNLQKNERIGRTLYKTFDESKPLPYALLQALYEEKLLSIIVEGGSQLLGAFIGSGLWDEARIFTSPVVFNGGVAAPELQVVPYERRVSGADTLLLLHHPDLARRLGLESVVLPLC